MRLGSKSHHCAWLATLLLAAIAGLAENTSAEQRYPVEGLILKLDAPHQTMIVSCQSIPGFMDAMVMPFSVSNAKELEGLKPGDLIDFTLIVEKDSSRAEAIRVHAYQGLEPDPLAARRLKLLNQATHPAATKTLALGKSVPDFTLTDQSGKRVTLSQFSGKVVALNFIYTRCMLPNFCLRSSNNFALVQKKFRARMGQDLILLSVSFDPKHDGPEVLAKYASQWNADPKSWHFLTGPSADIQRLCDLMGEDFFLSEGLMNHSLHTAIIDRKGTLVANLEGNEFTSQQLEDLLETQLNANLSAGKDSAK